MSGTDRHTKAEDTAILTDPLEIAQREASNAVRQFDMVLDMIDEVARDGRPFKLRTTRILQLHEAALSGLSNRAGAFRQKNVTIELSKHQPPAEHLVGNLMDEMCDWVNDNWDSKTALELCAYVMWRLNWIHPFSDGNGRTSRAVAYLALCAKIGDRLPGRKTLPEQIAENKAPYYDALEKADEAWNSNMIDTSAMQALLESYLAVQLKEAFDAAKSGSGGNSVEGRKFH
jgi:Fic family protein